MWSKKDFERVLDNQYHQITSRESKRKYWIEPLMMTGIGRWDSGAHHHFLWFHFDMLRGTYISVAESPPLESKQANCYLQSRFPQSTFWLIGSRSHDNFWVVPNEPKRITADWGYCVPTTAATPYIWIFFIFPRFKPRSCGESTAHLYFFRK